MGKYCNTLIWWMAAATLLRAISTQGLTEVPPVITGHAKSDEMIEKIRKLDESAKALKPKYSGDGEKSVKDQSILSDGNAKFSVSLYQALLFHVEPTDNLIFSPLSISLAISKLYMGASGNTASQIKDSLSIPDLEYAEDFIYEFEDVLDELQNSKHSNRIFSASQIFCDENIALLEKFQAHLAMNYDYKAESVDFGKADDTVKRLGQWLAESTDNELKSEMFSLAEHYRMLLADAFYMEPFWDKRFLAENTRDSEFTLSNGEKVTVQMMHQTNKFYFGDIPDHDVVFMELPLAGRKMSMFIYLLPISDEKPKFEENLLPEYFSNAKQVFKVIPVEMKTHLSMPKLRLQQSYSITETLKKLGITDLFSMDADLPGVATSEDLYVDDIIHTAAFRLDETGSAKPSAPIDALNFAARQVKDVVFQVDRPFIFTIKENKSNTIILMGKIQDPSSGIIGGYDVDKEEL